MQASKLHTGFARVERSRSVDTGAPERGRPLVDLGAGEKVPDLSTCIGRYRCVCFFLFFFSCTTSNVGVSSSPPIMVAFPFAVEIRALR